MSGFWAMTSWRCGKCGKEYEVEDCDFDDSCPFCLNKENNIKLGRHEYKSCVEFEKIKDSLKEKGVL